jgi:hypothetical protein
MPTGRLRPSWSALGGHVGAHHRYRHLTREPAKTLIQTKKQTGWSQKEKAKLPYLGSVVKWDWQTAKKRPSSRPIQHASCLSV